MWLEAGSRSLLIYAFIGQSFTNFFFDIFKLIALFDGNV